MARGIVNTMKRTTSFLIGIIVVLMCMVSFLVGRMTVPSPPSRPFSEVRQLPSVVQNNAVSKTASESGDSIPVIFHGLWGTSLEQCRAQGIERVSIAAQTVDYYESHGKVLRVATVREGEAYAVKLSFEGEGDIWERTTTFERVGSNLQTSDADSHAASEIIWYPCAKR